ncbi:MAG TPA: rod shape-determining protein MreD [Candidatus Binataceae bacterium]|nr:rod shape-determining protein MreD [Candidatus Binataceae bacterium]
MRLAGLFIIAALGALAVQTAIPYWLPLGILFPNLVVILAVDLGLRHHGAFPALLAFAMGYATDAFSGSVLGLNAFLITLIYLLSYEVSRRLMVTNALVGAVAVFVGALIAAAGALAIGFGMDAVAQLGPMFPRLAGDAAITALLAPPIFAMLARCKKAIGLPAGAARE